MRVLVAIGMTKKCAKDLCEDFREARENAKQALLDKDFAMYQMCSQQMRSLLELDVEDEEGNVARVVSYLTQEEQNNPYQLNQKEDMLVSQWIVDKIREKGRLN